MNIVLFGGAFNPPHLGHLIVVTQAFEMIPKVDEVWLLPEYRHSFEKNSKMAPAKKRLEMTWLFAKKLERVRVETCTIDEKMSGQTIEHVRFLEKKYPDHNFSFLMGSDQLKRFTEWGRWQELLKKIKFYIYPRVGFEMRPMYKNMQPLKHELQAVTNISSTMVRQRINQSLSIDHLVTELIFNFLTVNKVY